MTRQPPEDRLRLLDVNVLAALSLAAHVHHRAAHTALSGMTAWATSPMTEAGLIRLLLNPAVTGAAYTGAAALAILRGMRQHPRWRFLPDDVSLADTPLDLSSLVGHRQVSDVHLVALASRHGAVVATFDARLPAGLSPADRGHVEVLAP